jgi:hypothetical protein
MAVGSQDRVVGHFDHVTPDPNDSSVGQCRTFRYRLHPTVKRAQRLDLALGLQCELYNSPTCSRASWSTTTT